MHSRIMKKYVIIEVHCTNLVECVAQVATIHNTHMCAYNGLSSVPSFLPMQINTYATISINIFICGPIIFIDKVSVRLPAICSPLHFSFSYFLPLCRIEHKTIQ